MATDHPHDGRPTAANRSPHDNHGHHRRTAWSRPGPAVLADTHPLPLPHPFTAASAATRAELPCGVRPDRPSERPREHPEDTRRRLGAATEAPMQMLRPAPRMEAGRSCACPRGPGAHMRAGRRAGHETAGPVPSNPRPPHPALPPEKTAREPHRRHPPYPGNDTTLHRPHDTGPKEHPAQTAQHQ